MADGDLEKIIENAKKGIFPYIGIDPSRKYDRNDFLMNFYLLGEVKGYEDKINKTQGSIPDKLKRDLAGIVFGSKEVGPMLPESFVRDTAKETRKTYEERMAFYVQNNYDAFIGAIDKSEKADDMFMKLAFSVPLYEQLDDDGKVKDNMHNKTVQRIKDYQEAEAAQKTAQEGDSSKMRNIAEKSVKGWNIPDRLKKLLLNYLYDPTVLNLVFQAGVGERYTIATAS